MLPHEGDLPYTTESTLTEYTKSINYDESDLSSQTKSNFNQDLSDQSQQQQSQSQQQQPQSQQQQSNNIQHQFQHNIQYSTPNLEHLNNISCRRSTRIRKQPDFYTPGSYTTNQLYYHQQLNTSNNIMNCFFQ